MDRLEQYAPPCFSIHHQQKTQNMSQFPKRMTVKVNLDKVLKEHLYQGQKGKYLDLVLFNTPDSPYGDDFVVKQDLGKEARDAGTESPILGNAKAWDLSGQPCPKDGGAPAVSKPTTPTPTNDDLPF